MIIYIIPHSTNSYINIRTPRGPPGVGFKLTQDGNYDMENKKLTKVAEGTDNSDAITKHQLDTGLNTKIDNSEASSGDPEARKLVRYQLSDKGIILRKLYLEDEFNDSMIVKADNQDFDDIPLYIPNLKNYDGNNSRRKSEILVSSTDQTITGDKTFQSESDNTRYSNI